MVTWKSQQSHFRGNLCRCSRLSKNIRYSETDTPETIPLPDTSQIENTIREIKECRKSGENKRKI